MLPGLWTLKLFSSQEQEAQQEDARSLLIRRGESFQDFMGGE